MKNPSSLAVSPAEWTVMEVVWAANAAIPSEVIISKLTESTSWSEGTIRSLLNRLIKKEALATKREGRRFLYRATRERSDYIRKESESFLERYFDGKLTPMMACFLGDESIGDEELDRLEALIREKRKELE